MAQEYFATHEIPNAKVELQHIPLIARYFHQEIVVYDVGVVRIYVVGAFYPRRGRGRISTNDQPDSQRARLFNHGPGEGGQNVCMCALRGKIHTLCKLLHHAARCTNRQTKIVCPGEKIWHQSPCTKGPFMQGVNMKKPLVIG